MPTPLGDLVNAEWRRWKAAPSCLEQLAPMSPAARSKRSTPRTRNSHSRYLLSLLESIPPQTLDQPSLSELDFHWI